MKRFTDALRTMFVGIMATTIAMELLLPRSFSFITPVSSMPSSSSRNKNKAEAMKDSLLNFRGGDDAKDTAVGNGSCNSESDQYSYRTVQVQVVHRHGDRTPITPLRDEEFWTQQLVPEDLLERVAKGTRVVRRGGSGGKNKLEVHAAQGRGPFGKLTKLGLLGMIQVGTNLKEELEESTQWSDRTTASSIVEKTTTTTAIGTDGASGGDAIRRTVRFAPEDIKVYSTDFARTIQSVQGLLVGFFPDGFDDGDETDHWIDIDCRDTISWMIPDPQPRQTKEQEDLERQLAQRPHVLERDLAMKPLAVRVTQSLLPILGNDAFEVSFGVEDNEENGSSGSKEEEELPTLPWIQLTEITKCLSVRDMLPDSVSSDDQEALSAHTAWKWFQSLRNPRLAYLSMRRFLETLVSTLRQREDEPPLIVYSCHDSSLIGLLCALNLEQPSVWPEYGAVLKIELLEKRTRATTTDNGGGDVSHVLRFSLNGQPLRSMWHDTPRDEIALDEFVALTSTERDDLKLS
jgi:acid phosphatase